MSRQPLSLAIPAALGVALCLACSGAGSSSSNLEFTTDSPVLIQGKAGLWDAEGHKLSDLAGSPRYDLYTVPTSAEPFFLFAAEGVHVARREGAGFSVQRIAEGEVLRPVGSAAVVRRPDGTRVLMDAQGEVLHADVTLKVSGDLDPPVNQPEYWWSTDYFTARPAPVCLGRTCGWMDGTGSWVGDTGPNKVPPMVLDSAVHGGRVFSAQGDPLFVSPDQDDDAHYTVAVGPASDGRVLARVSRRGPDPQPWPGVFSTSGALQARVDADVAWEDPQCAGELVNRACRYRYHEGRAAVWIYEHGAKATAYLGPNGEVAIGPTSCDSSAPSGPFHEGRAFQCIDSEYWMVDHDGARIAGPYPAWESSADDRNSYPSGLFFSEGLAAVPLPGGGWGYVDPAGEVVLPGPYQLARPFRAGVAGVKSDGEARYINSAGETFFVN